MKRAVLALTSVLALACGGDDGGASIADAPTCNPGELKIEGTLDGTLANVSMTGYNVYNFTNAVGSANGFLNVGFPTGENLLLEFPDFTNEGKKVSARAFVDFVDSGGPFGGFCDTMSEYASDLVVPKEGKQYEFRITRLRATDPFCASDSAYLEGELVGCFMPRVTVDAGP
jgi:hypothetical protein